MKEKGLAGLSTIILCLFAGILALFLAELALVTVLVHVTWSYLGTAPSLEWIVAGSGFVLLIVNVGYAYLSTRKLRFDSEFKK